MLLCRATNRDPVFVEQTEELRARSLARRWVRGRTGPGLCRLTNCVVRPKQGRVTAVSPCYAVPPPRVPAVKVAFSIRLKSSNWTGDLCLTAQYRHHFALAVSSNITLVHLASPLTIHLEDCRVFLTIVSNWRGAGRSALMWHHLSWSAGS